MPECLRDLLDRLAAAGELTVVDQAVDLRHVSARIAGARQAVLFNRIQGYDTPLVGGILNTRERLALAMQCASLDIGKKFGAAVSQPIPPVVVKDGPVKEVIHLGAVDLTSLPIPFLHEKDGAPYISGTVVFSRDPEYGANVGSYRLMYRGVDETGIDLVSPSDLRLFYQRALSRGEPLPIAIALGCHPSELLAAAYKAPTGLDEMGIAGALHGEPMPMVRCETVDLLVPANAEIILEGEILPIGWTEAEGRFGEFNNIQSDLKWNPVVRYKAVTHRRNPLFYALTMPWENDWLMGPVTEAAAWRILREASVEATAVRATPGSACYFTVIAAIRKRPGEGKNAVLALLALSEVKLAIVTDDDIDIFNWDDVDWAMTYRVQADRDVTVISGARAKHVDPSLKSWLLPKGSLPTTAKLGIDATIPDGVPRSRYERPTYPFAGEQAVEAGPGAGASAAAVAEWILARLEAGPLMFHDILKELPGAPYRHVLQAWSEIRRRYRLDRDESGHYLLAGPQE